MDLRRRLFEERSHLRVPFPPLRPGENRVRVVADEIVLEAELLISPQAGDGLPPDQVTSL